MAEVTKMIGVTQMIAVWECAPEDFDRMQQWMSSKAKFAFEMSQRGPVITMVFDGGGHEVGRNVVGSPSEQAKKIAAEYAEEEEENPHLDKAV